ncbi:MAG: cytochrome c oxidase subunit II transmembrane domain-containing protein [Steroidobacteraceae bacterium]
MMVPAAILWICAFVVAGVFAVMIHSIATFRRAAEPGTRPNAHSNKWAEIFWAIVPIFIMVSTALPAVRMLTTDQATCCGSGFSRTAFNADRK